MKSANINQGDFEEISYIIILRSYTFYLGFLVVLKGVVVDVRDQ